jgi:AcrR family transcriptional regulator
MLDRGNASRHRRKQARPRELLDAALALFVEKGFAAARAEDIAARAGVSKATLYLYFRSKEDLLKALIEERFASRIVIEAHETTDARASQDLLRDVLTTWRSALMQAHAGGIFKLVLTEIRNFPALAEFWSHEVIEPARRLVSRIVVRGIDRGEFRPVDPDLVVHALVLPIIVVCLHRDAMRPSVPDDSLMNAPDVFSRHFELVLEGLTSSVRLGPRPHPLPVEKVNACRRHRPAYFN